MKLRKTLALLLAALLLLGSTALAAGPFTDVASDAYYAEAVAWAAENGITTGKTATTFEPNATVNRAQAVTFLWRMAGKPEPTKAETFTDVEADANNAWYKTAVAWAVEQGITNGTGGGKFSPFKTCSRAMILAMLYRMNESPLDGIMSAVIPEDSEQWTLEDMGTAMMQAMIEGLRGPDGFTDVKQGMYYEYPVYWAMLYGMLDENQIDMEKMAVRPDAPCPRAEMVYFLYRNTVGPTADPKAEVGTLAETVAFDKDGVKITITGIGNDDSGDPRLSATLVNGSKKTLMVETSESFVNTYAATLQAYDPKEDDDGFVFYANPVAAPGETLNFYIGLNGLEDMGIDAVREIETQLVVNEVKQDSEGYYDTGATFGESKTLLLRTSLYDASVSYEPKGTPVYDKDGLKLYILKAENDEYMGPQIRLCGTNSSGKTLMLDIKELKLDGKVYETFFVMEIPAGKRCVSEIYIDSDEDLLTAKEAVLTLETQDPETWEPIAALTPITFAIS